MTNFFHRHPSLCSPFHKLVLLLSLTFCSFAASAAAVVELSAESFAQYGPEDAYWTVQVSCEGSDVENIIQRKTDGTRWCVKGSGDLCGDEKNSAARLACSDEYLAQLDEVKARENAQRRQLAQRQEAQRLEEQREEAQRLEAQRRERAEQEQRAQLAAAAAPAATAPITSSNDPNLQNRISIEEQRLSIEQQRLELRRRELELERRKVEIEELLEKMG